MLGIDRERPGLGLGRNNGTTEITRQWRPETRHLARNARIVARQPGKAVGHIVVIGAVQLFGSWTTRAILLQGPQHGSGNENERECRAPGQYLTRQASHGRTFWTQAQ